jgi:hypothetical protein
VHPGLPWVGCAVLIADSATLRTVRAKAASSRDTFVADVPAAAQSTRVYSDFAAALGKTLAEDMDYCAVSIVGPRNRVDKIVGKLPSCPSHTWVSCRWTTPVPCIKLWNVGPANGPHGGLWGCAHTYGSVRLEFESLRARPGQRSLPASGGAFLLTAPGKMPAASAS